MDKSPSRGTPLHPLSLYTTQGRPTSRSSHSDYSHRLVVSPEKHGVKPAALLRQQERAVGGPRDVLQERACTASVEEVHRPSHTSSDDSTQEHLAASRGPANQASRPPYSLESLQALEAENKRLRDECQNCQRMLRELQNESVGGTQAVEEERNDLLAGFQKEYASKDARVRELEGLLVTLRNDTAFATALRRTKTELEAKVGTLASILGDVQTVRTPISRPESFNFGRPQRVESWRNSTTVKRRSMRRFDTGSNSLRPLQLVTARSSQSAPTSALSPLNTAQNQALLALEGKIQYQSNVESSAGDSRPSTSSCDESQPGITRSTIDNFLKQMMDALILDDLANTCLPSFVQCRSITTPCECSDCREPSSRHLVRRWMRRLGMLDYLESFLETPSTKSDEKGAKLRRQEAAYDHEDSGYVSPELMPAKTATAYG